MKTILIIVGIVGLVALTIARPADEAQDRASETKESGLSNLGSTDGLGQFLKTLGVDEILKGVGRLIGNVVRPRGKGILD
uniref:Uncharacterized protein n=1 Tax=Strigamia maritima TaxID=126957 RepID=T1IMU4_STRMM